MTPLERLRFLAPALAAVSDADAMTALDYAQAFRPACLPEDQQELAQVYYALYLLYDRKRQTDVQNSGIVTSAPPGVKAITEGDVRIEWAQGAVDQSTLDAAKDPSGFLARWKALDDVCRRGAITASVWRPPYHGCY